MLSKDKSALLGECQVINSAESELERHWSLLIICETELIGVKVSCKNRVSMSNIDRAGIESTSFILANKHPLTGLTSWVITYVHIPKSASHNFFPFTTYSQTWILRLNLCSFEQIHVVLDSRFNGLLSSQAGLFCSCNGCFGTFSWCSGPITK